MTTNGQHCLVWRVGHDFRPLFGPRELANLLAERVVVEDCHVTKVVRDGNMTPLLAVGDRSRLLVDWESGKCRGRLNFALGRLVRLAIVHVERPELGLPNERLVLDAVLIDEVVITTSKEGSCLWDNLQAPGLAVVVCCVNDLTVAAINIDCLNLAVVVTDEDASVKNVEGTGLTELLERDLSKELVFTLVIREK